MKILHANSNSVKFSSSLSSISILLVVRCSIIINIAIIVHTAIASTEKCRFERASSAAASLKDSEGLMDFNANPCNNFFDYACANWHLPYALRALEAHDSLTAARAANKQQLLQYFEGQIENEQEQETVIKAKQQNDSINNTAAAAAPTNQPYYAVRTFYKSCLEQTRDSKAQHHSAKVYMAALQNLNASRILNHNLISNNDSQLTHDFEWWQISAELQHLGVHIFWQLLLRPNWQSAEQEIFYLVSPTFGYMQHTNVYDQVNKTSVETEEIIFLKEGYIKYLLLDLGLHIRPAIKLANELVKFELALMELKDNEDSLILNAPQTLSAWSQELPQLHLEEYFQKLLLPSSHEQHDEMLNMLLVVDKKYFRKLQKFLTAAEPHLLARYMLIKFLTHFELHLAVEQDFMEHKLYCLQQLQTFMPRELTQLFLDLQFNNNSAQYINEMHNDLSSLFDKLKSQFQTVLQKTEIFEHDAPSRIRGLEKLHAMRLILPQLQQVRKITKDYKLTKEYSENLLELWRLRVQRELLQLRTSMKSFAKDTSDDLFQYTTSDEDTYAPLDVTAYYSLKKNAIVMPVGLLTATFYNSCMPRPQLYGRLMYIIAHELLHGYDYDGLNYDKAGNVENSLEPKTLIKYGTKAMCYFKERYTNAALNINENIADSEGLRLALETLLSEENEGKDSIQEEDLKLFFLNFSQTWCGKKKPYGTHAKHRERVNNAVSNFKEFATIYKCAEKSALNPPDKCKIW